jgi:tetratricopeptide (TPR) repeat protein
MTRFAIAAAAIAAFLIAAPAALAQSQSSALKSDMAGMAMPPMQMPPMPALYGQADKPGAPMFKGLGDHHHPISTGNPQAQAYFDQGIELLFGFNHAEAIRSFREAALLDPDCAMCWWGVAFALGPNINLPMQEDAIAPAWAALRKAQTLESHASPQEREWVDALATRYSADPKADRKPLDEAFAQAMGKLRRAHGEDLDAGVFYAEAMMDTQPWDYWEHDGETSKGHGQEIVATLEDIIRQEPNHPGALHLYIHAVEASTHPERAEAAADRLEPLMPAAGHIVHMPSHIYYRVGRYADAVHVNELAAKADEDYITACRAQGFYPLAYYSHNIHFLWTSSEMMGRYQAAIDAAQRVVKASANGPAEQIPPLQLYLFTPIVTDIRFGKWDAALSEIRPAPNLKLDSAVWLYASGFAHANKHDFPAARKDRAELAAMIDRKEFTAIDAFGVPGTQMAQLGVALLDGEILRLTGHLAQAIVQFGKAREIERALPYTEPPYWHQPVSHILGAALLAAHRPAEAEAVYRDSLNSYRIDGWALYGLTRALEEQHKANEAAMVRAVFDKAWSMADVKLASSRF